MKKCLVLLAGLLVVAIVFVSCSRKSVTNPDPNHTHADFAVVVLGQKLDFSAPEYMSTVPSSSSSAQALRLFMQKAYAHEETNEKILPGRQYLHLHDGNGNVIHRHKPGLTLGNFFTSIGLTMTTECFTLDAHQFDALPQGEGESYALTKKLCNNGKFRWQMYVNAKEVPFNPDFAFEDGDRILLTYDAADVMTEKEFDSAVTEEACMYSKTCPWKGDPPTENCIADPTVPCVVQ